MKHILVSMLLAVLVSANAQQASLSKFPCSQELKDILATDVAVTWEGDDRYYLYSESVQKINELLEYADANSVKPSQAYAVVKEDTGQLETMAYFWLENEVYLAVYWPGDGPIYMDGSLCFKNL